MDNMVQCFALCVSCICVSIQSNVTRADFLLAVIK